MLSLKSSSEKNYELGGYIGNTLGHTLLAQPGTAQRFSPMPVIAGYIVGEPHWSFLSRVRQGDFSAKWKVTHWKSGNTTQIAVRRWRRLVPLISCPNEM